MEGERSGKGRLLLVVWGRMMVRVKWARAGDVC